MLRHAAPAAYALRYPSSNIIYNLYWYRHLKLVTIKAMDLTSSKGEVYKAVIPKDQYVAQRVKGTYIATVCQLETAFNLFFVAQIVNLKKNMQSNLINDYSGKLTTPPKDSTLSN